MRERSYRKGILAVFKNNGSILVCKRSDTKTWQFPQGGLDDQETPKETLYREMKEEIGTDQFSIIKKLEQPICYEFPKNFDQKIANIYKGQCLYWFLCEFKNGNEPDLEKATTPEFSETKWQTPQWIIDHIVYWKKEAYVTGLNKLELI